MCGGFRMGNTCIPVVYFILKERTRHLYLLEIHRIKTWKEHNLSIGGENCVMGRKE